MFCYKIFYRPTDINIQYGVKLEVPLPSPLHPLCEYLVGPEPFSLEGHHFPHWTVVSLCALWEWMNSVLRASSQIKTPDSHPRFGRELLPVWVSVFSPVSKKNKLFTSTWKTSKGKECPKSVTPGCGRALSPLLLSLPRPLPSRAELNSNGIFFWRRRWIRCLCSVLFPSLCHP